MSLATRCPACGTVFRVVRDQLKVSEGWVRCGRCSEVFDGGQRLFELEHDAATVAPQPDAPAPPQEEPARAVHSLPAVEPSVEHRDVVHAGVVIHAATARMRTAFSPPSEPAMSGGREAEDGQPLAQRALTPLATPEPAPAEPLAGAVADMSVEAALDAPVVPAAEAEAAMPGFILRADRAARWRHPARRGLLAALSTLLAATLAAQMALHYRDALAAGWPASQPWLQAACNMLGCRIEAPRRIGSLSVDSSGLVRVEGSALYRLSLVVQNRAVTAVRMPAIDLALTDTQGQMMARRVLYAAELGNPSPSLPAHGEVALQGTLDLGERRVAGYTVELFYP